MDSSGLELASCSDQECGRGVQFKHRSKSISAQTLSDSEGGCFQCNICLESAHDPVVTLCGHLYCWPCIYKWFHVHSSHVGDHSDQSQKCPVCEAKFSSASLVPLYGSGASKSNSEVKKHQSDPVVPRRPTSIMSSTSHSNWDRHQNYIQSQPHAVHHPRYFPEVYRGLSATPPLLGGTAVSSLLLNPTIGTFGEMIFSRIFGSTDGTLFPPNSNFHPPTGNTNPRIRRQELRLDKSLGRISFFLFCCVVLCLLLF